MAPVLDSPVHVEGERETAPDLQPEVVGVPEPPPPSRLRGAGVTCKQDASAARASGESGGGKLDTSPPPHADRFEAAKDVHISRRPVVLSLGDVSTSSDSGGAISESPLNNDRLCDWPGVSRIPLTSLDFAVAQQAVDTLDAFVRRLARAKLAADVPGLPDQRDTSEVDYSFLTSTIRVEVARALASSKSAAPPVGASPLSEGRPWEDDRASCGTATSSAAVVDQESASASLAYGRHAASSAPGVAQESAPAPAPAPFSTVAIAEEPVTASHTARTDPGGSGGMHVPPPKFATPLICMNSAAGRTPLAPIPNDCPTFQQLRLMSMSSDSRGTGMQTEPSKVSKVSKVSNQSSLFGKIRKEKTPRYSGRFMISKSILADDPRPAPAALSGMLSPFQTVLSHVSSAFTDRERVSSERWATRVVGSAWFRIIVFLAVVGNAVVLGAETHQAVIGERSLLFERVNMAINVVFFVELVIRVAAERWDFVRGDEWQWNLLDTVLVGLGIGSDIAMLLANARMSGSGSWRVMRLMRVLRTFRILKSMKSAWEFQKMLYALMSSMRTLLCSLLILVFVIYFFGVLICQAIADSAADRSSMSEEESPRLQEYWGDLPRTFITLFMAITSGVSWEVCFLPLLDLGWVHSALFISYIVLCLFGVMNVVTSVFVESAVSSAQHYKHLIIQEKASEREIAIGHLQHVFRQIDEDGSGEISGEEMELFLEDAELRKYIEALDINAENARMLFRLLDRNNSSHVDIDEFCDGCLRLQGDAKSFDVHAMMYQMRTFLSKWSDFTIYVEERFATFGVAMGLQDSQLRDGSALARTFQGSKVSGVPCFSPASSALSLNSLARGRGLATAVEEEEGGSDSLRSSPGAAPAEDRRR